MPDRLVSQASSGLDTTDFGLFAKKSSYQVNNRVFRSRMLAREDASLDRKRPTVNNHNRTHRRH